jgi:membrane-associated phospholipid phosphatase
MTQSSKEPPERGTGTGGSRRTLVTAGERRRFDAFTSALGSLALLATIVVAKQPLSQAEIGIFRPINGLPDALYPVLWPLMQYGTFITIPILTLLAIALRRFNLAIVMATAGMGVYFIAKFVKVVVDRPRPSGLLSDVMTREVFAEGSLGFPSGHAAVATALVITCSARLGGWWWRAMLLLLAIIVPIGRIYVGAHLPLDLLGGAALGAIAASVANLVFGVRGSKPERSGSAADTYT